MGLLSKPKAPKKTGEQKATEIRTRSLLDKEIEEEEERFKFLARGKLGRQSLLSGAPRNTTEAALGRRSGGAGSAGSLLGGGGFGGDGAGVGRSGGGFGRAIRAPRVSQLVSPK